MPRHDCRTRRLTVMDKPEKFKVHHRQYPKVFTQNLVLMGR